MGAGSRIRRAFRCLTGADDEYGKLQKELQELKKSLEEVKSAQKNETKAIGNLTKHMDQEFARRDEWNKMEAQTKREADGRPVWVIKCPSPEDESRTRWGDYHYALSLKKYLERLGLYVLVDTRENWGCESGADVVLVLRGCLFYRPDRRNGHCTYIMWNISHPDMVTKEEYELYDVVCVGSKAYAKKLAEELTVPVVPLLQCTDTEIFCPSRDKDERTARQKDSYIFIGNSRGIARSCVMWAVEEKLPFRMWGSGWNRILKDHMDLIQAPFIENDEIPALYRSAKATLNDHWQDMLDHQFINNRIFDALACGLPVISDGCQELREIFPDAVLYYSNKEEFQECVRQIEEHYDRVKEKVDKQWELIDSRYSFRVRAKELVEIAKEPD